MNWSDVVAFTDAVREHRTNLHEGRAHALAASAERLVAAWKRTGNMASELSVEELKHRDIDSADDRLQRVEEMLRREDGDRDVERDLFQKLVALTTRKLADAIVRRCHPTAERTEVE